MKTRRLQKTEISILPLSRGCGYGQCHRIESTVPPTVPQWVCFLRDQHGGLEQGNGDLCVHHLVLSGCCYSSGKQFWEAWLPKSKRVCTCGGGEEQRMLARWPFLHFSTETGRNIDPLVAKINFPGET